MWPKLKYEETTNFHRSNLAHLEYEPACESRSCHILKQEHKQLLLVNTG